MVYKIKNGENIDCQRFKARGLDDESEEENPDELIVIQGSTLLLPQLMKTAMLAI